MPARFRPRPITNTVPKPCREKCLRPVREREDRIDDLERCDASCFDDRFHMARDALSPRQDVSNIRQRFMEGAERPASFPCGRNQYDHHHDQAQTDEP